MKTHPKPRVKFCWHYGRKLYGRHHAVLVVDGYPRTLHESCVKEVQADPDYRREERKD